jgi:uncharacterized membrane protein YdbT with pleckstrin-like domain
MSGYIQRLMGANEKVIVIERQHWMVWVPTLIVALLLFIVITVLGLLLSAGTLLGLAPGVGAIALVLNVIPLYIFLRKFLDWYNEQYIVTNRRIVQAEGVINKTVIDSSLEKINDVVLTQTVVGRMMDFGDLEILTGSEIGINKLQYIQSPLKFKRAMLDAKEALRDPDGDGIVGIQAPRPVTVGDRLEELERLRKTGVISEPEYQEKRAKLMSQL